jgi:RNA polymerase sigma-70 factor (ECF subfamily)
MDPIVWQEDQAATPALAAPVEDRFARLYADYRDDVVRYVLRRSGERGLAIVVADVFAVAKERVAARPAGEDSLPWLYAIASAVVRMQPIPQPAACPDCGGDHGMCDPDDDGLEESALLCAVGQLDEKDREILRLRAWEGLSDAQIATVTGLPERAVQVRLDAVETSLREAAPPVRIITDDRLWMPSEESSC